MPIVSSAWHSIKDFQFLYWWFMSLDPPSIMFLQIAAFCKRLFSKSFHFSNGALSRQRVIFSQGSFSKFPILSSTIKLLWSDEALPFKTKPGVAPHINTSSAAIFFLHCRGRGCEISEQIKTYQSINCQLRGNVEIPPPLSPQTRSKHGSGEELHQVAWTWTWTDIQLSPSA